MNYKTIFILTLIFAILSKYGFACDCNNQGTFLAVAPQTDFVALVKVSKYLDFQLVNNKVTPISMEVEIIKIFKGVEERKKITVWGDNGFLCRPYISRFDTTKYYIIAFNKSSDSSRELVNKNEKAKDYFISNCGEYWLEADIEKKIAIGLVWEERRYVSFDDLSESISNNNTNKNLTHKDYQEIFQLVLDLPELQNYFLTDKDISSRGVVFKFPIITNQYDNCGVLNKSDLTNVVKFGNQIKLLTSAEIEGLTSRKYFVVQDWICKSKSLFLNMRYIGMRVQISFEFTKINNKWEILSSELSEG